MHNLFYYSFSLLITSLPLQAMAKSNIQPTPIASQQVPVIKVGDIVADNYFMYRKLVEITPQGYYKVQNFYKETGTKQSDIFIIKDLKNLNQFQPIDYYRLQNLIFDGHLLLWSEDGNKAMEVFITNGNAEGSFTSYYTDGKKEIEGHYKTGKPEGLWLYWTQDEKLAKQVYYKTGIIQWQKNSFTLTGS